MMHRNNELTREDQVFLRTLQHGFDLAARRHFQALTQRDVVETAGWHVTLEGHESLDMYDHAPGVAYYTVDASRFVPISGYMTASEVMNAALAEFDECRRHNAHYEHEHDGMFTAKRIVIRDPHGIVARFQNGAWQGASLSPESWEETEARIAELSREASEESRWDNFDTARRLRHQAERLREDLVLSKRSISVPF